MEQTAVFRHGRSRETGLSPVPRQSLTNFRRAARRAPAHCSSETGLGMDWEPSLYFLYL